MKNLHEKAVRPLALLTLLPVLGLALLGSTGCALIIRGKEQKVILNIRPEGNIAFFEGREYKSGDQISIEKGPEFPRIYFKGPEFAHEHELEYDPDPWLIADAGLLLLGIIPGVIALGVDIGTGAWRYIEDPQTVYLPFNQIPVE